VVHEVTLLAAGGTISSIEGASGGPGAAPGLDAAGLVAALPGDVRVEARTVLSKPGPQLSLDDALTLAREAVRESDRGRGVVLTSGTDTIEEVAVLCDALLGDGPPVVVTGAMRTADAPGAEGPANILDAMAVASDERAAGLGAVVCFSGELHAARAVRKIDSTAPHAFGSPRSGPIGRVAEARLELFARPLRGPRVPLPPSLDLAVPIVTTWLGDDGALLRAALDADPAGLVLVALGGGHLPPPTLAALGDAPSRLPVALCLRPERAHHLRATYGFAGSERDVLATGVIPGDGLSAPAARMLLLAGLGAGLRGADLRAVFAVGA